MPNERFVEMLSLAARGMTEELRTRLIPHRGEEGSRREETIRRFLREYLPRRYEVSSGFVFDANGDVSGQIDVVIADSTVAPSFRVSEASRLFPCEAVVAAGEIKTNLTSRPEMWKAFEKLSKVSCLDRSAASRAVCSRTGEPIDHINNHLHRVFTFIFVADRALSSESTADLLLDYVHGRQPHEWPNLVLALGSHAVTFCCDDGVCPNTMHARGISQVPLPDMEQSIAKFYVWLSQAVATTSVSSMSSWAYLGAFENLAATVFHSTFMEDEEPPPFLSRLSGFPRVDPPDMEPEVEVAIQQEDED